MGCYDESRRLLDDPEKLMSLVQEATGGTETWKCDGAWIEIQHGFLSFCHNPEVVEHVEQVLAQMSSMK